MRPFPTTLSSIAILIGSGCVTFPAPSDGADPAGARVAAQCAAFWEGAGETGRARAFRDLARELADDPAGIPARIAALRPDMTALARDRHIMADADALWQRHARLCGGLPETR